MADRFVTTGAMDADNATVVGLEAALIWNSFSLQAEYVTSDVDSAPSGDPRFDAYYVMVSWFVTDEHRTYSKSKGAFGRILPEENLDFDAGTWGALEIAVRFSSIDLTDGLVKGRGLQDLTGGLNWYLNPNTRITLNYILANRLRAGDTDIFMIRIQIDF